MPAKKQSKTNWNSTIVDFLDLDTDKFSFTKPKLLAKPKEHWFTSFKTNTVIKKQAIVSQVVTTTCFALNIPLVPSINLQETPLLKESPPDS